MNTWKNFQFSFIAILWWPATFNYAAVKSPISFSSVADNQCSTWKFNNSIMQKKRLSVLFPPHKRDQIYINFTIQNCTVPSIN